MACSCTIYDVRREQIEEASGRLWIRLVCNVCEREIDAGPAAIVRHAESMSALRPTVTRPGSTRRFEERAGGEY